MIIRQMASNETRALVLGRVAVFYRHRRILGRSFNDQMDHRYCKVMGYLRTSR
jgi:hypothetical protein